MARTLIVLRVPRRLTDILEAVDLDGWVPWVDLGRPSRPVWESAGLVLLDADRLAVLNGMPAHSNVLVVVGAHGANDVVDEPHSLAERGDVAAVVRWPQDVDWLRTQVCVAERIERAQRLGDVSASAR